MVQPNKQGNLAKLEARLEESWIRRTKATRTNGTIYMDMDMDMIGTLPFNHFCFTSFQGDGGYDAPSKNLGPRIVFG